MEFAIEYVGQHPILLAILICTTLVLMLLRSMIRAFQRWEILPDPLLPALRDAAAKAFRRPSGKDDL